MPNLFRDRFAATWFPDADAENAPPGVFLRGDNLVMDEAGAVSLRQGSEVLDRGLVGSGDEIPSMSRVHSLFTWEREGNKYRFAVAGNKLYDNGVDTGIAFDGRGDVAFGTDSYQSFFARATVKKKFDGVTRNNWAIAAPSQAPILSAANATTSVVASFDIAETDPFTASEGAKAFEAGWDGTANGAMRMTPLAATGRASAYKKWTTDQDFLNIVGTIGGDTDLFDSYVAMSDPSKVDTVTMMFGLGTGTDPFVDDYYYFDFKVRDKSTVTIKEAGPAVPSLYRAAADRSITSLTPQEVTSTRRPEDVIKMLSRLGRFIGPKSRERKDSAQASPAWSHLSVTRGQFNRAGSTSGRGWKTVRGFKVVVKTVAGSGTTVAFDSTLWYGGGRRALTGTFKCVFLFARDTGDYIELSPPSPESEPITLNQQGLNVELPAAAMASADTQVNQSWVYMYSDYMTAYFRVAVTGSTPSTGMSLDEFAPSPHGGNFDLSDWWRFTQWGMTKPGETGNPNILLTVNKSEVESMSDGVLLIPGISGPPDNIVAIVGPYNRRMFALTSEGWLYVSSQDSPSHYSVFHVLDLRRYGTPFWLKRTSGGIHAGFSGDIVRIAGSADEDADHASIDLYDDPLHTGNPPVDESVYCDGSTIIYRAADGLWTLSAGGTVPVSLKGVTQLWRGKDRHGVEALNVKFGRFRMAVDNHILYMIAPEGPTYNTPGVNSEDVRWGFLSGLTDDGTGVLTKTSIDGFGGTSAIATKTLIEGDGYVELTVSEVGITGYDSFFGLSSDSSDGLATGVDYGIYITGKDSQFGVYEGGQAVNVPGGQCSVGDVLRISVITNRVVYSHNGTKFYTSVTPRSGTLVVDVGIKATGGTLGPVHISGNWEMISPSSPSIWRYDTTDGAWYRTTYPVRFLSIHREPDGDMIAGDDTGNVWQLESGIQDDGANIPIVIWTPIDSDGTPLRSKTPFDLQTGGNTGGSAMSIAAHLDGSASSSGTYSAAMNSDTIHRQTLSGLADFARLQLRITGSFFRFILRYINVAYRIRSQEVMEIDTGYLSPPGNTDFGWIGRVEVGARSPVDLEIVPIFDDVERDAISLPVVPNKSSVYATMLRRGQDKGHRPIIRVRTTNPAGQGHVGFEPDFIRVWFKGTGNQHEKSVTVSFGAINGGQA